MTRSLKLAGPLWSMVYCSTVS